MKFRHLFAPVLACAVGVGLFGVTPAVASGDKPPGCWFQKEVQLWGANCNGWRMNVTNHTQVANDFSGAYSSHVYRPSRVPIAAGGSAQVLGQDSLWGPHNVDAVYTTELLASGWYRYVSVSSDSQAKTSASCGVFRWANKYASADGEYHFYWDRYPGAGCELNLVFNADGKVDPTQPVNVTFTDPGDGDWNTPSDVHL